MLSNGAQPQLPRHSLSLLLPLPFLPFGTSTFPSLPFTYYFPLFILLPFLYIEGLFCLLGFPPPILRFYPYLCRQVIY